MTLLLLAASLLLTQLHLVGTAHWGELVPDPIVPLIVLAGLASRGPGVPLSALALGWSRAVVRVEPAGGPVLAVLLAVGLVVLCRRRLPGRRSARILLAAVLAAGMLLAVNAGLELWPGQPVLASPALLSGTLCTVVAALFLAERRPRRWAEPAR